MPFTDYNKHLEVNKKNYFKRQANKEAEQRQKEEAERRKKEREAVNSRRYRKNKKVAAMSGNNTNSSAPSPVGSSYPTMTATGNPSSFSSPHPSPAGTSGQATMLPTAAAGQPSPNGTQTVDFTTETGLPLTWQEYAQKRFNLSPGDIHNATPAQVNGLKEMSRSYNENLERLVEASRIAAQSNDRVIQSNDRAIQGNNNAIDGNNNAIRANHEISQGNHKIAQRNHEIAQRNREIAAGNLEMFRETRNETIRCELMGQMSLAALFGKRSRESSMGNDAQAEILSPSVQRPAKKHRFATPSSSVASTPPSRGRRESIDPCPQDNAAGIPVPGQAASDSKPPATLFASAGQPEVEDSKPPATQPEIQDTKPPASTSGGGAVSFGRTAPTTSAASSGFIFGGKNNVPILKFDFHGNGVTPTFAQSPPPVPPRAPVYSHEASPTLPSASLFGTQLPTAAPGLGQPRVSLGAFGLQPSPQPSLSGAQFPTPSATGQFASGMTAGGQPSTASAARGRSPAFHPSLFAAFGPQLQHPQGPFKFPSPNRRPTDSSHPAIESEKMGSLAAGFQGRPGSPDLKSTNYRSLFPPAQLLPPLENNGN
jgi:hypothetical protein